MTIPVLLCCWLVLRVVFMLSIPQSVLMDRPATGVASVVLLPGRVWKPLLYMFVCNSVNLATAGFVDNFYLDPGTRKEAEVCAPVLCHTRVHRPGEGGRVFVFVVWL